MLRQAEIAMAALPEADDKDRTFYEGKIASAKYFARLNLPKARLRREAAEVEDGALMEMADEAF